MNLKGTALLFLFFISTAPLKAQEKPVVTDTISVAFLPALGYNTDLGLVGGGLFSRYHYADGLRPYFSYLDLSALASTKGLMSATVLYEKPFAFGTQLRLKTFSYLSRFLQDQFYGVGNYNIINTKASNYPTFYQFKSFSAGMELTLRRQITELGGHPIDAMAMFLFDYESPFDRSEDRLIWQEAPIGIRGGRTSGLGLGILWEGRNNEFSPTKGIYLNAVTELGQKVFGSSFNYFSVKADARAFHSFFLIREITFANRLYWQHTSGTVPYWKLAELGGELSMRGYPENRFLDENALYLNSELRTWLWDFPQSDFRLGGTLFIDVGRSYANQTAFRSVFSDLKYSYGFGGNASFFTNEFILRADIGFSEEGYGIYFTAGYMF